jgi:hypothetical protein
LLCAIPKKTDQQLALIHEIKVNGLEKYTPTLTQIMTYPTHIKRSRTNRTLRAQHYVNIDRQILLLHQAMAEKVPVCPQLQENVMATIERRYATRQLRHGGYLLWSSLLENIDDEQAFLTGC